MREGASALDVLIRPDEQAVALAEGYRLIQPLRGHRYSVDDMLVAHLACSRAASPRRVLDLGCGIGSVLLLAAWAFPRASLVGVEAQPEHAALARRNVLLNACESRARVVGGDLRDGELVGSLGRFDLVTATPPYFDPRKATPSRDPRRAAAHFELRGGIEQYARAASRALAPDGLLVACAAADPPDRARLALEAAGLAPLTVRPVLPRQGKKPFLLLVTAAGRSAGPLVVEPPLVLRRLDGTRTDEHAAIRRWSGVPCGPR